MPQPIDELLIIQQVLQGQQSAYAVLVDKYQDYVFTLAMRYVDNREVAEELAQDVFIKAYRCLADFKGNSKFSTWLYTIVNSTCLSHLRKKKDDTVLLEEERLVPISDRQNKENPAAKLEQKTQQQLLTAAMRYLPDDDMRLLSLFYQGEQSVEEVGLIMGLTAANVKVRLYRARQKLRTVLESRYSREIIGIKGHKV